ncbi:unnamed protein product [Effrenium voratum]|uniref:Protein arginine N-methyltransferase domain-containing protein n=1 Tax=Effrenium voratum TaxID=2562239 RepID=A0AA36ND89_9DINO|nr:unnamed protein product [Effrenium voratum]CAJ1441255.1 unnamed protein product [Effrenium voratum]
MEPSVSLHDLRAVYDPEMHVAMLRDGSRHRFYGQCLLMHPELKGQVAIDVGAGTGIMSAMAVLQGKLGKVHAVEALPEVCRLIPRVLEATLEPEDRDKVEVHCGFVEEVLDKQPNGWPQHVQLIISEWLGIMGLNEGMVRPLLHCRDAFDPKPHMLPGLLRIWVQPCEGDGRCGPAVIRSEQLRGTPQLVLEADLNTCSLEDLFVTCTVQLGASGLVGWFDLQCCAEHQLVLSTSPHAAATHWAQCWLPFGERLDGAARLRLRLAPQSTGLPELCVELTPPPGAPLRGMRFFLDRGVVERFGGEDGEDAQGGAKRRRTEDIEARYFPSDIAELLSLAKAAVRDV